MEPFQTHGATLPQPVLTRPAEGGQSGLQPEDLVLGGRAGANPHVGQQEEFSEFMDSATTSSLQFPGLSDSTIEDVAESGSSGAKVLTRLEAFKIFKGKIKTMSPQERVTLIWEYFGPNYELTRNPEEFKAILAAFIAKAFDLLKKCKGNVPYFYKKHADWLNGTLISGHLKASASSSKRCITEAGESLSPNTKKFKGLSRSTQYRSQKKLQGIIKEDDNPSFNKIKAFVATLKINDSPLSNSSSKSLETLIGLCLSSDTAATDILNKIKCPIAPYTPEEAVSIIIDRNLSVESYNKFHLDGKNHGYDVYPPYYKVLEAKKACYPDNVQISEREASVSVQNLVQHTFNRLIQLTDAVFINYCIKYSKEVVECIFHGIWGFDGSSGQALYKQSFSDGNSDESSIFATTFTPLQIITASNDVIWLNPSPQSYRYCRPVHIQYKKESKELILSENLNIQEQIHDLNPMVTETSKGHKIKVKYDLTCAAIDGKVLNTILDTTSQLRCPYCDLTSSQFNDLDIAFSKPIKEETLVHGISPLHSWIRALEFILKLGYKVEVKRWRITKKSEEGIAVEERKKYIQDAIREKMGLLVDVVRPTSGTTNDGNTARTAFADKNRATFAEILGLEKWLLDKIYVLLTVLSSNLPIDPQKFGTFCRELAIDYVAKYAWHPMTVTFHKILVHGAKIIASSTLPIGMLSEQGAESRNKFWRSDREHHSRKISREAAMFDLFHRALVSSDPVISDFGIKERKKNTKKIPLPADAVNLLKTVGGESHHVLDVWDENDENFIVPSGN